MAAAVPVIAVVPPSVWDALGAVMQQAYSGLLGTEHPAFEKKLFQGICCNMCMCGMPTKACVVCQPRVHAIDLMQRWQRILRIHAMNAMAAVILRAGMCRVVVTDRMHQDPWWSLPLSVLCLWSVQERALVLHGFMAWDLKRSHTSMSCHARRLLELLLDLARAAYVPAHLG